MVSTALAVAPYRPSITRAKWAMILIALTGAVLVYEAFLMWTGVALVDHLDTTSVDDLSTWGRSVDATVAIYAVGFVCSGIAFLAWLSRAVENTPALGGGTPAFSPRASIGWWFVPFANLVRGYQIVADLWRRMGGGGSQIVLLWWLLWIGTTFIDRAVGALADTVTSLEGYRTMLAIEAVSLVASAVGAGLAVWIIRETERRIAARASPSISATLVVPAAPATEPVSVAHSVRFCPTCGAPRTEGGAFCASCGRELPSTT